MIFQELPDKQKHAVCKDAESTISCDASDARFVALRRSSF